MGVKTFFSSCLGSCLGVFATMTIGLIVVISLLISTVSSLMDGDDKSKSVENSILHIDLKGVINEYNTGEDILATITDIDLELTGSTVLNILQSIEIAEIDSAIKGIFIECNGAEIGLAASSEIRNALLDFKSSGKWVYAYGGAITQTDYYIATAADSIFVNPVGAVDIHGLASTSIYYKNLLEKIGIDVQVLKSGKYKSAVEPFTETSMSAEDKTQRMAYINSIWDTIADGIAESRDITVDRLQQLASEMIVTKDGEYLLRNKIVDAISYRTESLNKMALLVGEDDITDLNFISPKELTTMAEGVMESTKDEIAVLYAVGEISEYSVDGIKYKKIVKRIDKLAKDKSVKALVLRVNSPGGSAYDSDQIWEALERFKLTGKPFVVSMSDLAASGGYYIACGADYIFAEPTTLTGSIGVFGIIPSAKTLLNDKLGVNVDVVSTNRNADLISVAKPMTPAQLAAMQASVSRVYDTFVIRVADGRDMSVAKVDNIAQGRVWSGAMAKEVGLVDNLGGLSSAINYAAMLADLSDYQTKYYPKLDSEWQMFLNYISGTDMTELFFPDMELIKYNRRVKSWLEQNPIQMIYYQSEIK
ncbi:MAG: signal peptide peptidase SppA [Bacteroidales bacterium]